MLDNEQRCEQLLDAIVDKIGLTKLESIHHKFSPQGVSIVQLLAESHIALHTWPETNQGYITITTCKLAALDTNLITKIIEQNSLTLTQVLSVNESVT